MLQRCSSCFFLKNFQSRQSFTCWNPVFSLRLRIWLNHKTRSFRSDAIAAKAVSQLNSVEKRKKLRTILQLRNLVLHFVVRIWDKLLEIELAMNTSRYRNQDDLRKETFAHDIVAYILYWYTQSWLSTRVDNCWWHINSNAALPYFYFKAKIWGHCNYWKVLELSEL